VYHLVDLIPDLLARGLVQHYLNSNERTDPFKCQMTANIRLPLLTAVTTQIFYALLVSFGGRFDYKMRDIQRPVGMKQYQGIITQGVAFPLCADMDPLFWNPSSRMFLRRSVDELLIEPPDDSTTTHPQIALARWLNCRFQPCDSF